MLIGLIVILSGMPCSTHLDIWVAYTLLNNAPVELSEAS